MSCKERITKELIAPCGMNCGVCLGHLRKNNPCLGCRGIGNVGPKTRVFCKIKLCDKRTGKYCFACGEFPCDKIKKIDLRYRTKFGMSEIKNLEFIRDKGIVAFVKNERKKYQNGKGVLSVHDGKRY